MEVAQFVVGDQGGVVTRAPPKGVVQVNEATGTPIVEAIKAPDCKAGSPHSSHRVPWRGLASTR
ncbi:hypothetical protein BN2537_561 [Streptomyces venezuelae]|nr:hypothetical protein BN2537_561 [Streptomyces venezuelae]